MVFGLFKKEAAADIIFMGGTIYTQNPDMPSAGAVACKDGLIIAVGDEDEIASYKSRDTDIVDLDGGFLLPGFIDTGGHPVLRAFRETCLMLPMGISTDELRTALTGYIAKNPDRQGYFAYGVSHTLFASMEPETAQALLDEICPDKYLALFDTTGAQGWYNSVTIEEVTRIFIENRRAVAAARGEEEDEDEAENAPPIHLLPMAFIFHALSLVDFDRLSEAVVRLSAAYSEKGRTTIFDRGAPDYFHAVYQGILVEMLQNDFLKQRFIGSLLVTRDIKPEYMVNKLMQKKTDCMEIDDFMQFNAVRFLLDQGTGGKAGVSPGAYDVLSALASERGFAVHEDDAPCEYAASNDHGILAKLPDTACASEAVDKLTLEAAEWLGISETRGSVTVNKKADFVIFREDPLACELNEFYNLSAAMTVLDGNIVFDAEEDTLEEWLEIAASEMSFSAEDEDDF